MPGRKAGETLKLKQPLAVSGITSTISMSLNTVPEEYKKRTVSKENKDSTCYSGSQIIEENSIRISDQNACFDYYEVDLSISNSAMNSIRDV